MGAWGGWRVRGFLPGEEIQQTLLPAAGFFYNPQPATVPRVAQCGTTPRATRVSDSAAVSQNQGSPRLVEARP